MSKTIHNELHNAANLVDKWNKPLLIMQITDS